MPPGRGWHLFGSCWRLLWFPTSTRGSVAWRCRCREMRISRYIKMNILFRMGQIHSNPKIQLLWNCTELYAMFIHFDLLLLDGMSIHSTNHLRTSWRFQSFDPHRRGLRCPMANCWIVYWRWASSANGRLHQRQMRADVKRTHQSWWMVFSCFCHVRGHVVRNGYPLVNVYITMEKHHLWWVNQRTSTK